MSYNSDGVTDLDVYPMMVTPRGAFSCEWTTPDGPLPAIKTGKKKVKTLDLHNANPAIIACTRTKEQGEVAAKAVVIAIQTDKGNFSIPFSEIRANVPPKQHEEVPNFLKETRWYISYSPQGGYAPTPWVFHKDGTVNAKGAWEGTWKWNKDKQHYDVTYHMLNTPPNLIGRGVVAFDIDKMHFIVYKEDGRTIDQYGTFAGFD